jgi:hypothetical protein
MPISESEFTEIVQRVSLLEKDVFQVKRVSEQNQEVVAAIQMKSAVADVHNTNIVNRLEKIESTLVWLNRIVLSGIIGAVLMLVMGGMR